ncbi:HD domain-containing protein [bacterium]|nr:HD domain-containing protein [bacterium]
MQQITVEELINYKILPFNIYTKGDKLLFPEGEVLTPGKFLQLRHIDVIYRKLEKEKSEKDKPTESKEKENTPQPKNEQSASTIDTIEFKNVVTQINKFCAIPTNEQIKLKVFYEKSVGDISKINQSELLPKIKSIRDKIQNEYSALFDKAIYSSELRLIGEYDKCHAINVAMLTAALSRKLGKSEEFISDIILAALLHDIGKICLPTAITSKPAATIQEQKLYQMHTKIGYNVIKNRLKLSDKIARVALEHHEHNDGTGYPSGKSGDFISLEGQIISVCNYFDNLIFGKTNHKIYNAKEALKVMLEMGSKNFAIDILYSFIYMYNYDDTRPFDEMILS